MSVSSHMLSILYYPMKSSLRAEGLPTLIKISMTITHNRCINHVYRPQRSISYQLMVVHNLLMKMRDVPLNIQCIFDPVS